MSVGAASTVALRGEQLSPDVRSGSPGYRQAKSGKNQHWHRRAVTVFVDDSVTKLGPGAKDAVMQAFGHWVESDPRLPDLAFDNGKTSAVPKQDGKSTVSYGPITVPGHERDLAITMTYSDSESGEIIEADVVLNSSHALGVLRAREHNWHRDGKRGERDGDSTKSMMSDESEDCRDRYDVQNVLTHEAGHFFGLGEDPVEQGATMFQKIDECETHKRALASTDAVAIGTLYAEVESPEEAAAGPRACNFGGAPAGSGHGAWASALLLGAWAVRRRRRA